MVLTMHFLFEPRGEVGRRRHSYGSGSGAGDIICLKFVFCLSRFSLLFLRTLIDMLLDWSVVCTAVDGAGEGGWRGAHMRCSATAPAVLFILVYVQEPPPPAPLRLINLRLYSIKAFLAFIYHGLPCNTMGVM